MTLLQSKTLLKKYTHQEQHPLKLIDSIFTLAVLLVSLAFGYFVYVKSEQNPASIYWAIYAFGCFFIPGIITAYPGYDEVVDNHGFTIKKPRGQQLSMYQAITIFGWIVGLGLLLVYITQFGDLL